MGPLNTEDSVFFSIIIPTFNRPSLVCRALNSIYRQNFQSIEVILIDDCSTKDYSLVCLGYSDLITSYFRMPQQSGVSAARNLGMTKSKGNWLVFLDDDDEFQEGFLHKMHKRILHYGNNSRCFFWANVHAISYDKNGVATSQFTLDYSNQKKYGRDNYVKASTIGCSYGLTVNRNILINNITFDTSFEQAEDTDFVLQLMSGQYIPEYLTDIGVIKHNHASQRLSGSFDKYSQNKVYERIFEKHYCFLKEFKEIHSSMLHWASLVHYWSGNLYLGNKNLQHYFLGNIKNFLRFDKAAILFRARSTCRKRIRLQSKKQA